MAIPEDARSSATSVSEKQNCEGRVRDLENVVRAALRVVVAGGIQGRGEDGIRVDACWRIVLREWRGISRGSPGNEDYGRRDETDDKPIHAVL